MLFYLGYSIVDSSVFVGIVIARDADIEVALGSCYCLDVFVNFIAWCESHCLGGSTSMNCQSFVYIFLLFQVLLTCALKRHTNNLGPEGGKPHIVGHQKENT
ncbi:733_t:CDS:1 [Dentiscutata erythropus]|uniref:733_t:CDS:1 n=1 Tax=Dentiscutata erythropus TaxID=1348616 RepID=A0A9N9N5W4_9GLOM|nr:733_t:CDS:1 [Dentiscutata erythropus]